MLQKENEKIVSGAAESAPAAAIRESGQGLYALGYKLKEKKGYWDVFRVHGTYKLIAMSEHSGFKEIPFPSLQSLKAFLKNNAEGFAYLDIKTMRIIIKEVE